jgi:hypothetical protein
MSFKETPNGGELSLETDEQIAARLGAEVKVVPTVMEEVKAAQETGDPDSIKAATDVADAKYILKPLDDAHVKAFENDQMGKQVEKDALQRREFAESIEKANKAAKRFVVNLKDIKPNQNKIDMLNLYGQTAAVPTDILDKATLDNLFQVCARFVHDVPKKIGGLSHIRGLMDLDDRSDFIKSRIISKTFEVLQLGAGLELQIQDATLQQIPESLRKTAELLGDIKSPEKSK